MELQEWTDKFLEIEYKYQFFEMKLEEVYLWQYIRIKIYSKFRNYFTNIQIIQPKSGNNKALLNDMVRENPFNIRQHLFSKKQVIFFNHPRKVFFEGEYICKYTEEFVRNSTYSNYVFECSYEGGHFIPCNKKNTKYIDENIYRWLFNHLHTKKYQTTDLQNIVDYIFEAFQKELGVPTEAKQYVLDIVSYFSENYKWKKAYYKFLLRCVSPKVIVIVDEYSADKPLIVASAKEMNITTVALMHGNASRSHPAYNFFDCSNVQLDIFPDYYLPWTYDDIKDTRLPIETNHVIPIGFQYLELQKNKYACTRYEKKKRILFISGTPKLGRIADQLGNKLNDLEYEVVYRMHPREHTTWKESYPYFENSKVCVSADNKVDIYEDILKSDFVVGVGSAGEKESVMLGKPTIIMCIDYYQCNQDLIENKYVYTVRNIEELISVIMQTKKNSSIKWMEVPNDSVQRFNQLLDTFVQKRL